ncbi:MAG: hypothetical protein ACR2OB_08695 [Solirubrobacteraceae bacterium]
MRTTISRGSRFASVAALTTLGALGGAAGLTLADAAPGGSGLPTIRVTESGKTISVGGTFVSGAVNVVTTTSGEAQGSPVFFALRPGVTAGQVLARFAQKRVQNTPDYANDLGSLVFDAEADRGVSQTQTVLRPGNYLAVDLAGNGRPPSTTFTVTANPQPAALPAPTATISGVEFGFRGPSVLHQGSLVRVKNDGFLVHMFLAVPVKGPRQARRLTNLLRAGKDNKAMKLAAGPPVNFAGPLGTGAVQQAILHAARGYYVLVCFMDTQDGREHTRLGMERTIRVVR